MTSYEESDAPRSQDSITGGIGGAAVSHVSSALISEPGFFLDLGKVRPLVNSSPQPASNDGVKGMDSGVVIATVQLLRYTRCQLDRAA